MEGATGQRSTGQDKPWQEEGDRKEGGIGVSLKLHPHPVEPLTSTSLAACSQATLNVNYQEEQPGTANQAQGNKWAEGLW